MIFPRVIRRWLQTVLAGGLTMSLVSCAFGLDSLQLPALQAGGANYGLTALFSNALNLPTKAKVKLYGADVGEVESIEARDFTARVVLRIRADVPLHAGVTAQLRSATLLGDVFVQVKPDPEQPPDAPLLRDGDTIPLADTAAAPTVEELLNSMALLVNGGTISYLVKTVNGAGEALGGRGQKVGELLDQTDTLLSRMAARSVQLDAALRSTADLAAVMMNRRDTLDESLTVAAPAMAVIADHTTQLADLADGVARITGQLSRFPSIQGTDTGSVTSDLNKLAGVFNDISVDPDLRLYAFNRLIGLLIYTTNATSAHLEAEINKLALGAWPDGNYPGDPGFHWSDGTDWHMMIGSLRYEWNTLLDQIYGAERCCG